MKKISITILILMIILGSIFPNFEKSIYFIGAIILCLRILSEIIFKNMLRSSNVVVKFFFGDDSLFLKYTPKKVRVGTIILYCAVLLWSLWFIIGYIVERFG